MAATYIVNASDVIDWGVFVGSRVMYLGWDVVLFNFQAVLCNISEPRGIAKTVAGMLDACSLTIASNISPRSHTFRVYVEIQESIPLC